MSSQPAPANGQAQKEGKLDFPKRFLRIFGSHLFGAAKQVGLPESTNGIMFYSSEVSKRDKDNKPYRYKPAHLGQAVSLTPEQVKHIVEYLGLNGNPFGERK